MGKIDGPHSWADSVVIGMADTGVGDIDANIVRAKIASLELK